MLKLEYKIFAILGLVTAFLLGTGLIATPANAIGATASISGTMKNSSNQGVPGFVSVFSSSDEFSQVGGSSVGSDGVWSVGDLAAGSYKLKFEPDGNYVPEWWNDQPAFASATAITVSAGETSAGNLVIIERILSSFTSLSPARLADTRGYGTVDGINPQSTTVRAGVPLRVPILGRSNVPLTGVGSVALNVTVVSPRQSGWLTVFPTGESIPLASNLNFSAGQTIPNMVIAKVGADGSVSISSPVAEVDIIVDIAGWYAN